MGFGILILQQRNELVLSRSILGNYNEIYKKEPEFLISGSRVGMEPINIIKLGTNADREKAMLVEFLKH